MKLFILLVIYFNLAFTCYSQVGIGIDISTPGGMLEISSGDEAKLGLAIPVVAKLEDVKNAITGQAVKRGTVVFDEQRNTICHKTTNSWSCFNGDIIPDGTSSFRPLSTTDSPRLEDNILAASTIKKNAIEPSSKCSSN